MTDPTQRALATALRRILRPLVRVLLRNGVPFAEFAEHTKKVYVEVAAEEFRVEGRKPSISRTAILTGLTRKDVSRLAKLSDAAVVPTSERYNRAARVISGWVRDPRFASHDGEPAELPVDSASGEPSFVDLVRLHGGDVPARAVLDELLRVGAVAQTDDERIRLIVRAYVPARDGDEKLAILGADVAELIATIDHNITRGSDDAFFQRKVSYDNLPAGFVAELRRSVAARAQALLEEFDREMAPFDRDQNPDAGDSGRMLASIGIYYFESEVESEVEPDSESDPDDPADPQAPRARAGDEEN